VSWADESERTIVRPTTLFICLILFAGLPAWAEVADPLESLNRKTQAFNDLADKHVLRPVASGYRQAMPGPAYNAVNRVFGNLADVGDAVNNLLQAKPGAFISDLLRVSVNTTIGLGGLFDPATKLGLVNHEEDFAQTLAVWGVPRGPYLVMPLLGPSSLRDAFARPVNNRADPLRYLRPVAHRNSGFGVRLVQQRAELLSADSVVFGDRYLFFREAYVQRRQYLEQDGRVDDPFDDEFDDF
jgi:phospholipid-binding lipoprotein MlaA